MKKHLLKFIFIIISIICVKNIEAQTISAGGNNSFFICNNNMVNAWGYNNVGALGDGTASQQDSPVTIGSLNGIIAVSSGGQHTLFLKSDGTVWAVGGNSQGALGDSTTSNRNIPVQVVNLSGITAIAAGEYHSLFLKNDGTVWACGGNNYGSCGNGSALYSNIPILSPVQVVGITNVISIEAGGGFSLFLKNDGTVWACGYNSNGMLGDGTANDRNSPVQISSLSNVMAIAAGLYHSLFLKNDGTVWACGDNSGGQLGDGSITQRLTPVQTIGLSSITAISAGSYHSLFLKSDSTVWATGVNGSGQLGDSTTVNKSSAIQSYVYNIVMIEAGWDHSLFVNSNGDVFGCGRNQLGALGIGTSDLNPHSSPSQVIGLCLVPPTAQFSFSTVCQGSATNFTDGSTDLPTSWSWNFGDGNTSTLQNPSHTYATAGMYNVSLTVANANGSDTVINNVVINPLPIVTVTTTNITCNGMSNGSATALPSGGNGNLPVIWTKFFPSTLYDLPNGGLSASASQPNAWNNGAYGQLINNNEDFEISYKIKVENGANQIMMGYHKALPTAGQYPEPWSSNSIGYLDGFNFHGYPTVTAGQLLTFVYKRVGSNISTSYNGGAFSTIENYSGSLYPHVIIYNDSSLARLEGAVLDPYQILWSSGGIDLSEMNLSSGSYTVTVTDSSSCSSTSGFSITEPQVVSANITTSGATCSTCADGSITVAPTGGVSPYNIGSNVISWNKFFPATLVDYQSEGGLMSPAVNTNGWSNGAYGLPVLANTDFEMNYKIRMGVVGQNNNIMAGYTHAIPSPASYPYGVYLDGPIGLKACTGQNTGCTTITNLTSNQLYNVSFKRISGVITVTIDNFAPFTIETYNGVLYPYAIVYNDSGQAQIEAANLGSSDIGPFTNISAPVTAPNLTADNYSIFISDANGCFYSTNATVSVNCITSANFISNNVCLGGASNFTNQSTNAVNYNWDFGNGTTSTTLNPTITYNSPGTYNVTLIASDTSACADTITQQVSVFALPNISITPSSSTVCMGTTITLTAGGANTYSWNTGATAAIINVNPAVSTNYTLIGTDANNCSDTVFQSITVNNLPVISAIPSVNTICFGSDETVTLTASGALTYLWSTSSSGAVVNVNPVNTTNYTVNGTDVNGCVGTGNVTVNVNMVQSLFQGDVFFKNNGTPININSGKVYLFNSDLSGSIGATDSANIIAGGSFDMGGVPFGNYKIFVKPNRTIYPFLTNTYYDLKYTWNSASVHSFACADTTYKQIELDSISPTTGGLNIGGHIFADSTYTGKVTIQGDPIPGVDVALEQNPGSVMLATTTTNSNGAYSFSNIPPTPAGYTYIIYANIPGFGLDSSYIIHVNANQSNYDYIVGDSTIYIDSALSAIYNGVKHVSKVNESSEFKVFPNPYKSSATISYELKENAKVELAIYNSLGQLIQVLENSNKQSGNYRTTFSAKQIGLTGGVYIAKLNINNTSYFTRLVEIE